MFDAIEELTIDSRNRATARSHNARRVVRINIFADKVNTATNYNNKRDRVKVGTEAYP